MLHEKNKSLYGKKNRCKVIKIVYMWLNSKNSQRSDNPKVQ